MIISAYLSRSFHLIDGTKIQARQRSTPLEIGQLVLGNLTQVGLTTSKIDFLTSTSATSNNNPLISRYLPNEILEPYIESILKSLGDSLTLFNENPTNKRELNSIANNASLTIGNIVLKIKAEINISLGPIYKELTIILNNKTLDKGLAKHCCFTLGKLGLVDPKSASEYLHSFIKPWCIGMRYLPTNVEKYQSFTGIGEIIKTNPKAIIETFDFICEAIYEYGDAPEDLQSTFKIILQSFKDNSGESWGEFYGALPQEMQQKLSERYEI